MDAVKGYDAKHGGKWAFAHGLNNWYPQCAFRQSSLTALRDEDAHIVNSIALATLQAGVGGFHVLFLELVRRARQTRGSMGVSGDAPTDGVKIDLRAVFTSTGEPFKGIIGRLDFAKVAVFQRADPAAVGDLEMDRATVVIFSRAEVVDRKFESPECGVERASRNYAEDVLSSIKTEGTCHQVAWKKVSTALRLTTANRRKRDFDEVINVLPDLATHTDGIEDIVVEAVAAFGWENLEDLLTPYLSPSSFRNIGCYRDRIKTISALQKSLPELPFSHYLLTALLFYSNTRHETGMCQSATVPCGNFCRFSMTPKTYAEEFADTWKILIPTFEKMLSTVQRIPTDIDLLQMSLELFGNVFEHLDLVEVLIVKESLATQKGNSELSHTLIGLLDCRIGSVLEQTFPNVVENICNHRPLQEVPGLSSQARKAICYHLQENTWTFPLSLVARVMEIPIAEKKLQPQCQAFLSAITRLEKSDLDVVVSDVFRLQERIGEPVLYAVQLIAMRQQDIFNSKIIQDEIALLTEQTRVPPPDVNMTFTDFSGRIGRKMSCFLQSRKPSAEVSGFPSIEAARKHLQALEQELPQGFELKVIECPGSRPRIRISKPFAEEGRNRLLYEMRMETLKECLDIVAERARTLQKHGNQDTGEIPWISSLPNVTMSEREVPPSKKRKRDNEALAEPGFHGGFDSED